MLVLGKKVQRSIENWFWGKKEPHFLSQNILKVLSLLTSVIFGIQIF